ncbi:MAG: hypothetical protein FWE10_02900 [Rikenellaceae bacterium]|nr:hypothetical protein [Rikenellaceae bacterium]MCL2693110.1 hypothetical protein [Rikenellaceae bacterium]
MKTKLIRIYLDANIIFLLRNEKIREERSDINLLYRFIIGSKISGKIDFPYSDAHLRDLVPSYKKEGYKYVERDLAFLSTISDNKCICLYEKDEMPTYAIREPYEFFEYLINDKSQILPTTIEEFENIFSNVEMYSLIDLFKTMPSGIDIYSLDMQSQEYFATMYPRTYKENNMYSFIADTLDMIRRIMTDPQEYNTLKKQFSDYIPLDKNMGNVKCNVIDSVNKNLTESCGKNFNELLGLNKQYIKSELYHKITSKYMHLDFVGYASEKLTDKNKYDNLYNDARHCFYGAYGNMFITNDKKAYKKAKAIYEEEKIETLVMNTEEFEIFAESLLAKIDKSSESVTI